MRLPVLPSRARLGPAARRTLAAAGDEAAALGHDYLGTEHLLVALAGERSVAPVLENAGLTSAELRREVEARVGRGVGGRGRPDADALAAIGIDLDEVRRRVEETFGAGALERARARSRTLRRTPCLEKALAFAARDAGCDGTRVGPKHLLLALASCGGIAGEILAANGVSPLEIVAGTADV